MFEVLLMLVALALVWMALWPLEQAAAKRLLLARVREQVRLASIPPTDTSGPDWVKMKYNKELGKCV